MYSELHEGVKNDFGFHKTAVKLWISKMGSLHEITNALYMNLLKENLTGDLKEITENYESGALLRQLIQISNETTKMSSRSYESTENYSPEDFELLLTNYSDYLTDLSINEENINWCAHSLYRFDEIYSNMESNLLNEEKQFTDKLAEVASEEDKETLDRIFE